MDMTSDTDDPMRAAANRRRPRIESGALLGKAKAIVIDHEGAEYVLRITSQNKLILTK